MWIKEKSGSPYKTQRNGTATVSMTQTPSPTDHTEEDRDQSSPEAFLVVSLNPIPSPSLPFITVIPITSRLEEDPHKLSDEASESDLFLKSLY